MGEPVLLPHPVGPTGGSARPQQEPFGSPLRLMTLSFSAAPLVAVQRPILTRSSDERLLSTSLLPAVRTNSCYSLLEAVHGPAALLECAAEEAPLAALAWG